MMIEEFEKLTGIFPTQGMYKIIEKRYMEFDGDKTEFCKAFKKNADGLAESIQRESNEMTFKAARKHQAELAQRNIEIERLKKELERAKETIDREQEWQPYEASNMSQDRYENLAKAGKGMTVAAAANYIEEEFGFRADRVKVFEEIPAYQINRHRQIRKNGTVKRSPVYDATDWNYIRFDCGAWQYEVVNGQLYQYCD